MQRLKRMRWMLALPILLGLGLNRVQGAPTEELEQAKVESGMPFGEAAGLASSNGEAVLAGPAGSTRPGLAKAEPGANSGERSGERHIEEVSAPQGASPSGKNHTPSKKGLGKLATLALLAMTAVLVFAGCAKKLEDYTPADAGNLSAKAVRTTADATFKANGAVEAADSLAQRHFGPGDFKSRSTTVVSQRWVDDYDGHSEHSHGHYESYYTEVTTPSEYEQAVNEVNRKINDAEHNVRKASDKVSEAAMVAAKSGPAAVNAVSVAREALMKAQQAVIQARESVRLGPNTNEAKAAAQEALTLSKEAGRLATEAQRLASDIALVPVTK